MIFKRRNADRHRRNGSSGPEPGGRFRPWRSGLPRCGGLARGGVEAFLADHDTVSLTNLNRQIIALHSTVGRGKAQVMKERIRDICPETEVTLCETFVLPENLAEVMSQAGPVDFILDAIDTVSSKLALAAYAKEHSIPIISAMGTGNKLYPELFRISDISQTRVCPLCRVMRRELKSRNLDRLTVCWSPEQPIRPSAAAEGDKTKMRATPRKRFLCAPSSRTFNGWLRNSQALRT